MGDDNYTRLDKFMTVETIAALCLGLGELAQAQDQLFSVVLHGGEPLLLGTKRLKTLLKRLRSVLGEEYPISMQTNGMLISPDVLDICSAYRVSVAVSIDGPREVHDRMRIGHQGEGTFDRVMRGLDILKTHPDAAFLNAGLLAVIDPRSDPAAVYGFFKELDAPSVDFLYKDGNHDRLPAGKAEVDSVEYGIWVSRLLDVYLADTSPTPIRMLDDMIKAMLGGLVSKEGMGLTDFGIVIVDTDGTVMKNDTLKSVYNGADRFDKSVNIADGNLIDFLSGEAFRAYRRQQRPTAVKCLSCPCLDICGGGMTLHRWSNRNGFNNPSVYCADQLLLIEHIKNALTKWVVYEH